MVAAVTSDDYRVLTHLLTKYPWNTIGAFLAAIKINNLELVTHILNHPIPLNYPAPLTIPQYAQIFTQILDTDEHQQMFQLVFGTVHQGSSRSEYNSTVFRKIMTKCTISDLQYLLQVDYYEADVLIIFSLINDNVVNFRYMIANITHTLDITQLPYTAIESGSINCIPYLIDIIGITLNHVFSALIYKQCAIAQLLLDAADIDIDQLIRQLIHPSFQYHEHISNMTNDDWKHIGSILKPYTSHITPTLMAELPAVLREGLITDATSAD